MRFRLQGLVHVRRSMWDIDGLQLMYTENARYLNQYFPINIIFVCNERALWVGDPDDTVTHTLEHVTCLGCIL